MSRRDTDALIRRIREELRAEGPDGAGYSDFLVQDAINSAIADLSEVFPVRDTIELTTEIGQNTYDLSNYTIFDIIKVEYNGSLIDGYPLKDYLDLNIKDEGPVNKWVLWGNYLIFIGEVDEAVTVKLWVSRAPSKLEDKGDIPETPSYADEAIIAFALSVCFRESRSYDRANYYYRLYVGQKSNILRRAVPQGQRESLPKMNDSYWKPHRSRRSGARSDTNPGGS